MSRVEEWFTWKLLERTWYFEGETIQSKSLENFSAGWLLSFGDGGEAC